MLCLKSKKSKQHLIDAKLIFGGNFPSWRLSKCSTFVVIQNEGQILKSQISLNETSIPCSLQSLTVCNPMLGIQ